jgi:BirA family biotin operon repressor/biotin-[acetyl-CoA-carboxylase] ligase
VEPYRTKRTAVGLGLVVERIAEIESTNAELLDRPSLLPPGANLAADAIWLIAGRQTGGRGRRGRIWQADPVASLAASLALELPLTADWGPIALVAGAAIATTLSAFGARPWLKWPNDIYVFDGAGVPAKAGGILCESRGPGRAPGAASIEGRDHARLVIGCGLNLFPHDWDHAVAAAAAARGPTATIPAAPVGHLFDSADPQLRERLEVALGPAILEAVRQALGHGPGSGLAAWARFDLLAGRPVSVLGTAGQRYDTTAHGVDAAGRLLVTDPAVPAGLRALVAEEVSVRWATT